MAHNDFPSKKSGQCCARYGDWLGGGGNISLLFFCLSLFNPGGKRWFDLAILRLGECPVSGGS